jgi:lysophospholipase L1-like esterase
VTFPSELTINALGMRGDLPGEGPVYRILAIGGSTTICVYLDDAYAWPYLLQERLNDLLGPSQVWVGNVGRPGHKTVHHILQVEKLLPQYPEVDAVILLVGINDLLSWLVLPDPAANLVPTPEQELGMAFSVFPGWDADTPWYRRNLIGRALWRLSWRPIRGTEKLQPMDAHGVFQAALRHYRQRAGRLVDALPDLEPGRADYVQNLGRIVDVARERGVQVVFVTQPTLWRAALPADEQALLWGGGPPFWALREGADYYSVGALAEAMARYNASLLEVCRERGVGCIDAASGIPHRSEFFFDDAHFTEAGSARLAGLIASGLLKLQLLAPPPERS